MTFADLGLSDELLRAVTEAGYTEPTPIQASAIPSVLMMRDLIGIAQTGTGKTHTMEGGIKSDDEMGVIPRAWYVNVFVN